VVENTANEQTKSLVIGGTGLVGGYIVEHLERRGERPSALSRSEQVRPSIDWFRGDLEKPDTLNFPPFATLYCTADAILLANALPRLLNPSLRRVVAFSSTSVLTKQDTEVAAERETIRKLADAERTIAAACEQHNVGWTILRPTLIYTEGRDTNITPLSRLIRRFGAIAAASSPASVNKIYSVPGGETLTYREMVGRIFDGMRRPRRTVSVPPSLWKASFVLVKPLFPGANVAMGTRMMKDMTFDSTPAVRDFGWNPRKFNPVFK
jgi:nucleoside-diphosphate-sugar epimerase